MMIRSAVIGSAMAMLMACGGKAASPAAGGGAEPGAATEPSAPPAQAAPAEPPPKPMTLEATLDIGAAMMAKDPDDSGWKGISIQAPAGAKVDVSPGGTMIAITDNMSIGLGGERDIAEKKKEAQESGLQKFVKFIVDEPDAILWETESGGSANFVFIANVKFGEDKVKSCQTSGYGTFTRQAAETLLSACKTMKLTP